MLSKAALGFLLLLTPAVARGAADTLPPHAGWLQEGMAVGHAVGLAVGEGRLWVADAATHEIVARRLDSGAVVQRLPLNLQEPKGLAFDGKLLWVADQRTKQIHAFDAATGKPVRQIPLRVPAEKGYRSVEGLTWDGSHLWTAIAAGFSSSFDQVDPASGKIVRSLFADCDPRGVASDGVSLWSLCFNGDKQAPTVDRRDLGGDEAAFQRSRQLVGRLAGRMPSGLLLDGGRLWTLDAGDKRLTPLPARDPGSPKTP